MRRHEPVLLRRRDLLLRERNRNQHHQHRAYRQERMVWRVEYRHVCNDNDQHHGQHRHRCVLLVPLQLHIHLQRRLHGRQSDRRLACVRAACLPYRAPGRPGSPGSSMITDTDRVSIAAGGASRKPVICARRRLTLAGTQCDTNGQCTTGNLCKCNAGYYGAGTSGTCTGTVALSN